MRDAAQCVQLEVCSWTMTFVHARILLELPFSAKLELEVVRPSPDTVSPIRVSLPVIMPQYGLSLQSTGSKRPPVRRLR